jgi:pyrroline-5-carboxylate reductase
MMRIGFIGAGNIAQALAKGFIAAGKQMLHFVNYFMNTFCTEIYVV